MNDVKLPNFLLVGAPKSGTTSLYYYLVDHPQVFMSKLKEPHFFSKPCKKLPFKGPKDETLGSTMYMNLTWEDYINLFRGASKYEAVGEASADYLYYFKCSIENIKKYLGNPRIIIILRNPIERAFSAYLHMVRDGREYLSFREALEEETYRKEKNWDFMWLYTDVGFYYEQVKAYIENFSHVKIFIYEDLKNNPINFIGELYKFLGIDSNFLPNLEKRYNVGGVPRSWYKLFIQRNPIKRFAKKFTPEKLEMILKKVGLLKPEMCLEDKEYLKEIFKNDILKLQDLINRDLSFWLK